MDGHRVAGTARPLRVLPKVAVVVCALGAAVRAEAGVDVDVSSYARAQRMVCIDGWRRSNLFCPGTGSPIGVPDAGAGGNTVAWRHVQGAIARTTQVFSYDRAGHFFGDPEPTPMDANNEQRTMSP
ncbi:hypothetical protein [Lichenicola sp.]|uniref:hypothetical protein n=1 Tax=Lichenicola sp. TaxID=2804529 RepID=UPI003AFFD127